jgi:hypothetical protein
MSDCWGNFVNLYAVPNGSQKKTELADDPVVDGRVAD